ncbi:hypothetical protein H2204_013339 [Knufia peltigerae]|uniref:Uncharacterized protein n=1 Tax=Knufia peltigerae TaxID=1002370 RepID=A0AA39CRE7_9EURO|nr:hypothetical protein H2204_013339 [Knufia peltigerae]
MRTESVDLENRKETDGGNGRAHDALNDVMIFGSVASRSCTSSRLGPNAVTESRVRASPSSEIPALVEPKEDINMEALAPPTEREAGAEAESDAKAQAGEWRLDEYMSALPSPPHVYLAQKFHFQHASLVPIPLRPHRVRASATSEKICSSESVEIDIRPVSQGTYWLHPHPLKSHPIAGDLLNQASEQESVAVDVQKQHHSKTDSNNRSAGKSALAEVCRPDSTTLGADGLTRTLEKESPYNQEALQSRTNA